MSEQEEHGETVDGLKVMLRQEEHLYSCPDYFAPDYCTRNTRAKQSTATPLHVVDDECAKLVADLSFADPAKTQKEISSPNDVRSRVEQTKSPESVVALPKVTTDSLVISNWRLQMCNWAYTVVDTFGFSRTAVALAFDLLDRYLAKECLTEITITRQDFQLLAMTALYLAVKLHESGDKLCLVTLIDMSRGYFSLRDFEDAELDILESLEWRVSPPTANCFLVELWKLHPNDAADKWISRSHDLLELSVSDAYFVPHKASQLALAAMLVTGKKYRVPQEKMDQFCDTIKDIVDANDDNFKDIYEHLLDQ